MLRRHRLAALASALAVTSLAACGGGGSTPAASCSDGLRNGAETAVDCGGPTCTPCPAGQACASPRDCLSGVCSASAACAAPSCADGVRNGRETGLDCGGDCAPCADGLACQVDGDCTSGRCQAQVCLKALGTACASGPECASATCADSVCCEADCAGTCEACNLPGRFGHCDPIPAGADPRAECTAQAPSTCFQDGACSGERSCRLYPAGTVCTPATCTSGNAEQPAAVCDGLGACTAPPPLACNPLTCDPAVAACRTRCADATECDAGYGCGPGGGCLKLDGQTCGADGDCLHGFCTDGVCCGSRCGGACEACNQPGRVGTCDPVPAGTDPADECPLTSADGCGTTGACSGTRSCAVWAGGTNCVAPSCASATTSNQARVCDGAGTCSSSTLLDCAPLICDAASGACKSSCAEDGDCAAGYACSTGTCKRLQGATCLGGAECASGSCVDGVCCESACAGTCERCDQAGRLGFCDAIPGGADPDGECADQGAASCGTSGVCSGARTCAVYPAGTTCAAAGCTGASTSAPADTCSGAGTCVDAGTVSCFPLTCNPTTGTCRAACSVDGDCAAGFGCSAGTCKKLQGQACAADGECSSGFCADSFCCDARCGGACEKCSQAGRAGFCDAIPAGADPDTECADQGAATCGTNGVCSGARSCARYQFGTVCAAASCTGATTSAPADSCDGLGACVDAGIVSCTPFACNAATGGCRSTCTVNGDCATGYTCAGGVCKASGGLPCTTGAQCGSGLCVDTVCCNAPCNGTCQSCNQAGAVGSCVLVASGADPDSECPADGCHAGVCNGSGACAVSPAGTVCAPGKTCDASGNCL